MTASAGRDAESDPARLHRRRPRSHRDLHELYMASADGGLRRALAARPAGRRANRRKSPLRPSRVRYTGANSNLVDQADLARATGAWLPSRFQTFIRRSGRACCTRGMKEPGDSGSMGDPALSGRIRIVAAVACAAALMGCSSNSQPRLEKEAQQLLPPGMELAEAERVLQHAGFTCGSYARDYFARDYFATCTRHRTYAVVATCVQRVNLASDGAGRRVSRFNVPSPACTSLYPTVALLSRPATASYSADRSQSSG